MTSAQPNGSRPTTTKLLSDLFNIKSSVLELHQNNQRVVDKIQEKVAKSQSLLKEELDCQRLLVRAQPTGQDKQETSLVTHREDNLAKRKPRHSAEFEVEQTTERTTLNFLASYREPTVRIGSGCEPSAYCFAKKQTRATHDGLHKYRSAATLQPYRENEVSKTDILSTQSKSPNISA
jgi:cellobiose-specific phosphotransferase system component IIA